MTENEILMIVDVMISIILIVKKTENLVQYRLKEDNRKQNLYLVDYLAPQYQEMMNKNLKFILVS